MLILGGVSDDECCRLARLAVSIVIEDVSYVD